MLEAQTIESILNHMVSCREYPYYGNEIGKWHSSGYDVLFDKLRRTGFKLLGTGNFSAVFSHKMLKNKVVKVTMHEDKGYDKWAQICKSEDNTYLPKIHYMNKTDKFCIYILDSMKQAEYSSGKKVRIKLNEAYGEESTIEGDGNLNRVAEILISLKDKYDIYFDLHADNIMQLPCGQLVITDPICIHGYKGEDRRPEWMRTL